MTSVSPTSTRPTRASWATKVTHVLASSLLTLLLFRAVGWKRDDNPVRMLQFLGALVAIMAVASPVSHTHYFVFALPLVMALTAYSWERNQAPVLSRGYAILFAVHILANVLSMPGDFGLLMRSLGLSFYGTMILWLAGIIALKHRAAAPEPHPAGDLKAQSVSA